MLCYAKHCLLRLMGFGSMYVMLYQTLSVEAHERKIRAI
jgi:hypothetical protein